MTILVGFLVLIAAIGGIMYLMIYREIPGAVEMRLGVLEDLPGDVNQWHDDEESEAGKAAAAKGLKREVRLFYDEKGGTFLSKGQFVKQARYRNRATNQITKVDPDEPVRRKRVKK